MSNAKASFFYFLAFDCFFKAMFDSIIDIGEINMAARICAPAYCWAAFNWFSNLSLSGESFAVLSAQFYLF